MNDYQKAQRAAKWSMIVVFGGILTVAVAGAIFWLHHMFFIDFQTYAPRYLPGNGKVTAASFSRVKYETDTVLTLETNRAVHFVEYRMAKQVYCSPASMARNETCVLGKTPKDKRYSVHVSYDEQNKPFGQSFDWVEGQTGISMGCVGDNSMCSLSNKDVERVIDSFVIKNYGLQKISTDTPG